MKYELVIQWPASSIADYDVLIDIEDTLIKTLNDGSKVDGHDAGSGEMNIFIHTNEPATTFTAVKAALGVSNSLIGSRVAYRALTDVNYNILWPEDLHEFHVT